MSHGACGAVRAEKSVRNGPESRGKRKRKRKSYCTDAAENPAKHEDPERACVLAHARYHHDGAVCQRATLPPVPAVQAVDRATGQRKMDVDGAGGRGSMRARKGARAQRPAREEPTREPARQRRGTASETAREKSQRDNGAGGWPKRERRHRCCAAISTGIKDFAPVLPARIRQRVTRVPLCMLGITHACLVLPMHGWMRHAAVRDLDGAGRGRHARVRCSTTFYSAPCPRIIWCP